MSSVWVILPTYNEAENLGPLVEQLLGVLASAGINHHVLVVDDGSPDGTGAIADRLAAIHTAVESAASNSYRPRRARARAPPRWPANPPP